MDTADDVLTLTADTYIGTVTPAKHPAKFSANIMPVFARVVEQHRTGTYQTVLDPFAGVGRIQQLDLLPGVITWGIELEPEWAVQAAHPERIYVGDSLYVMDILRNRGVLYDFIVTSPVYGNRMADHHEARDESVRNTYRHKLGRKLTEGSAAGMQWGDEYRGFHERAWRKAIRLLQDDGVFVLNVSDHIRKGERQRVSVWHLRMLTRLGMRVVETIKVDTPRQRQGENGNVRVDGEMVYVLKRA